MVSSAAPLFSGAERVFHVSEIQPTTNQLSSSCGANFSGSLTSVSSFLYTGTLWRSSTWSSRAPPAATQLPSTEARTVPPPKPGTSTSPERGRSRSSGETRKMQARAIRSPTVTFLSPRSVRDRAFHPRGWPAASIITARLSREMSCDLRIQRRFFPRISDAESVIFSPSFRVDRPADFFDVLHGVPEARPVPHRTLESGGAVAELLELVGQADQHSGQVLVQGVSERGEISLLGARRHEAEQGGPSLGRVDGPLPGLGDPVLLANGQASASTFLRTGCHWYVTTSRRCAMISTTSEEFSHGSMPSPFSWDGSS